MSLMEQIKTVSVPPQQTVTEELQLIPGIWVNGKVHWVQNCTEKVIYGEELVVKLKSCHIHSKISFTKIYISNHSKVKKEIKVLVIHHNPNLTGEHFTFISPVENRIFHLANEKFFLVNGKYIGTEMKECTVHPSWNVFNAKMWSNVNKGSLVYQPMAKGPAASIFTIKMSIEPRETKKVSTWSIIGSSKNELLSMERALLKNILAFPFEK
ncbi:hypothetical protein BIV60_03545 [Bacillus sp. MUM 116]|uniref:hypothetical protein n=1 Tax=Bacillus sp. MUM 116 TaxID=1678002 RepID=UPI0008F56B59|nr:hypothetical protein [Bacillus sp. MUM 116]OIK16560.1 hypothetical protein BIV60_03545 [Bacillus sp. MUM 116]